jgi:hypothetical protein
MKLSLQTMSPGDGVWVGSGVAVAVFVGLGVDVLVGRFVADAFGVGEGVSVNGMEVGSGFELAEDNITRARIPLNTTTPPSPHSSDAGALRNIWNGSAEFIVVSFLSKLATVFD